MDKRIVVRHKEGPRAGMAEIAGLASSLGPRTPAVLPGVEFGDRTANVVLDRVGASYVLYTETTDPLPEALPRVWEDQEADAMGNSPGGMDLPPLCG